MSFPQLLRKLSSVKKDQQNKRRYPYSLKNDFAPEKISKVENCVKNL